MGAGERAQKEAPTRGEQVGAWGMVAGARAARSPWDAPGLRPGAAAQTAVAGHAGRGGFPPAPAGLRRSRRALAVDAAMHGAGFCGNGCLYCGHLVRIRVDPLQAAALCNLLHLHYGQYIGLHARHGAGVGCGLCRRSYRRGCYRGRSRCGRSCCWRGGCGGRWGGCVGRHRGSVGLISASLHGLGRFSWRWCRRWYGHGRCLRFRRCGCCGHGHVRLCSRWRKVAAARWFSGGLLHRAVGRQGDTVRGGCCLLALTTLTALAVAAIAVA